MRKVGVGVVGLGRIAQLVHLPNLRRLADRFEVRHLCDLSPALTEAVAARLGGRVRRSTDLGAVLDDPQVEAVLLLTSGAHGPQAREALRAKKHVFAEKPLCLTVSEALELEAVAGEVQRALQVGYMKVHDPAVPVARAELEALGERRLVRVTVLHPPEEAQVEPGRILRFDDVPPSSLAAARAGERDLTARAIGDLPPNLGWLYREVLLGSLVHQVALVRVLLGALPVRFCWARAWPFRPDHDPDGPTGPDDPPGVVALGNLPHGGRIELTWLWLPRYPRYVEEVAVFGTDGGLCLDLPPPYDGRPGEVRVERSERGASVARVVRGPPGTGFLRELEAFHRAVVAGTPGGAGEAGAVAAAQDIRCLQGLLAALAEPHGLRPGGEAARDRK